MLLGDILRELKTAFRGKGLDTPDLDAEVLVAGLLGLDRYRLFTDPGRELGDEQVAAVRSGAARRLAYEPVAYILGEKEFYSLPFRVDSRVLIPRPETELLVDVVIADAPRGGRMLDLGTGSGIIAVSVKKNRPDLEVWASDLSAEALEVARGNAASLLGPDALTFRCGDLFAPVGDTRFHLIASNPPYVDEALQGTLQPELGFEPAGALYAADRGTAVIRAIIAGAGARLVPGGMLLLEIGADQEAVARGAGAAGGFIVTVLRDYAGLPRLARLKKTEGEAPSCSQQQS